MLWINGVIRKQLVMIIYSQTCISTLFILNRVSNLCPNRMEVAEDKWQKRSHVYLWSVNNLDKHEKLEIFHCYNNYEIYTIEKKFNTWTLRWKEKNEGKICSMIGESTFLRQLLLPS